MILRDMTRAECEATLSTNSIGHLGCISGNRPYVVPIRYVYQKRVFYRFSLPGKKIDSLRFNPRVCVQVEQLVTSEEWKSVLLEGLYRELPDDEKDHGDICAPGSSCRSAATGGNRAPTSLKGLRIRMRKRGRSSIAWESTHCRGGKQRWPDGRRGYSCERASRPRRSARRLDLTTAAPAPDFCLHRFGEMRLPCAVMPGE